MAKARRSQPEFLEHACIATRLLDGRRQLFDVKERFNEAKAEYELKSEILRQKEEEHRHGDLEFQANLIKFEAFSKKNESAYLRATKRLAEETELCVVKDEEARKLAQLLNEKRAEEQKLLALVGKKRRYHDVLASSDDGSDAFDILSHYDQLKEMNERTSQRQKEVETEISSRRYQLESLLKKNAKDPGISDSSGKH